jgi:hypothetical protein
MIPRGVGTVIVAATVCLDCACVCVCLCVCVYVCVCVCVCLGRILASIAVQIKDTTRCCFFASQRCRQRKVLHCTIFTHKYIDIYIYIYMCAYTYAVLRTRINSVSYVCMSIILQGSCSSYLLDMTS